MVNRFDVYLINLDDHSSADPKNTRPAVVVSPDELNRNVETAIVAPLSATKALYPTRVPVSFLNETRYVILDQIQTVDHDRLVKKIGQIEQTSRLSITEKLQELFAN
ncbi:MAG: type II toxin-antitoxin system PemK/MazF family toxin [bacterium]|nr:type II toxin-antitoxin system PemK/MazF family toxin [bacterium]